MISKIAQAQVQCQHGMASMVPRLKFSRTSPMWTRHNLQFLGGNTICRSGKKPQKSELIVVSMVSMAILNGEFWDNGNIMGIFFIWVKVGCTLCHKPNHVMFCLNQQGDDNEETQKLGNCSN